MTPERWQKVKQIFLDAADLDPAERPALIARVCAGDEALRREVESLLRAHDQAGDSIEAAALGEAAEMFGGGPGALPPRRRLGHYELISLIGRGGMGEVYLAEDTRLGRKVAIKLLPAQFTQNADRVRRFRREAETASALNHPNILTIHEIGEEGGTHFITTEFIEGETLRQRLRRAPLGADEALEIALQIASALAAAHQAGIIHRDVKPENVMLRPDGYVKLLDFGLAKLSEQPLQSPDSLSPAGGKINTAPGMILGTLAYMSPEQVRGEGVDVRSDVFSFGAVLYEMLTGRPVFPGKTMSDIMVAILTRDPMPLPASSPGVPGELQQILFKSMRKDPAHRYQGMKDLLDDLKGVKEALGFAAKLGRATPAPRTAGGAREVKAAGRASDAGEHPISIAVLPFANTGADPENEYFCDGLAEELLNALAKVRGLRVAARTSAFSFRGKGVDVRDVGRRLGVDVVLEGGVRRAGDRLRVAAQLVGVADGCYLWSERYDCRMTDVFAVQDEITLAIVAALKVTLFEDWRGTGQRRHTESAEAYEHYLKGRYFWNKRTPEWVSKGIAHLRQATQLDPNFAPAYAALADGYASLSTLEAMRPAEAGPKIREAAMTALALDGGLAEAHTSLGLLSMMYDWDPEESESRFRRAFELNPNYSLAHHWRGIARLAVIRFDESVAAMEEARRLDPLSLIINTARGLPYYYMRRYDTALTFYRQALEMDPDFFPAHYYAGLALGQVREYEAAVSEFKKDPSFLQGSPLNLAALGHTLGRAGRAGEAKEVLDRLLERSARQYASPYGIAVVYAGLGDREQAIGWLRRSLEDRSYWLPMLATDPRLDPLRDDGRFVEIVRSVGLASP